MSKLKKYLYNIHGLTLIELLAVIVILGIVSIIAVPAIGNVIENSKKDAHIANAHQVISAARLALQDDNMMDTDTFNVIPLGYFYENGYLERSGSPDGGKDYIEKINGKTDIIGFGTVDDLSLWWFNGKDFNSSYVITAKNHVVYIKLINEERGVQTKYGFPKILCNINNGETYEITRDDINETK